MRVAWERLQEAAEKTQPEYTWEQISKDPELLAVHVAMRAVRVWSDTKGEVSRAEWTYRLTKIAEHASALADLLEANAGLDEALNRFGWHYFPDDEWETVCRELAWEFASADPKPLTDEEEARADRRAEAFRDGLESEPLTAEEIAREAESKAEIDGWIDQQAWKLDRAFRFFSVSGALRNLHAGASGLARNPPFTPKGSDDERRLARLTWVLSSFFARTFRQPLDEAVATIAQVVTGQEVSPESVKMRRMRVRQYNRRGAK